MVQGIWCATYAFETLVFPSCWFLSGIVKIRQWPAPLPIRSCVHSLQNGIAHACSAQRMLLHLRSTDFSRFYTEGVKSPVSASKVLSKIGGLCFCTSKENYVFAGHYCIADGRSRHPLHDLLVYETGRPLPFSITAAHVYKIVYGCMHTQIESPYSNLCSAY